MIGTLPLLREEAEKDQDHADDDERRGAHVVTHRQPPSCLALPPIVMAALPTRRATVQTESLLHNHALITAWAGRRRPGAAPVDAIPRWPDPVRLQQDCRRTMNVVFLSPHFPPNWCRFVGRAARRRRQHARHRRRSCEELRPELRDALDDYYRVDDLADYDQLTRAMGFFIHRHGRIDRLDSLNEHWLETEAALRTDFNIPGINQSTIAPSSASR